MAHWLLKSEPDVFSFDDLVAKGREGWDGVRNYTARLHLRAMRKGDTAIFYHSNAKPPGAAGICKIVGEAEPDPTQFDPTSKYYDPKATPENPRWHLVEFKPVRKLARPVTLAEMKRDPALEGMRLLQRGNRLSVMPVEPEHYARVLELAES